MAITKWTTEEDLALIRGWGSPPDWQALHDALPGRTDAAILRRASRLSLTRPKESASTRWTEEEKALVRTRYRTVGPKLIEQLPGRTAKSLREMASALGVRRRG